MDVLGELAKVVQRQKSGQEWLYTLCPATEMLGRHIDGTRCRRGACLTPVFLAGIPEAAQTVIEHQVERGCLIAWLN